MKNEFKNEFIVEGYLCSIDLENKSFRIKNNDSIIELKYNYDFKAAKVEELEGNEYIRVKGQLDNDKDGNMIFLAQDILVFFNTKEGEE